MISTTLLCLHGYGLRGFFWDVFSQAATRRGFTVLCPDLLMESPGQAIKEIQHLIVSLKRSSANKLIVLGHSMGGILSALALQDSALPRIEGAVFLACPYGNRSPKAGGLLRFAIVRKLIPSFFVRQRFFGASVHRQVRKDLFAKATKENETFRSLVRSPGWFHTALLKPLGVTPALAISSQADQIVPWEQTEAFAAQLLCPHIAIPKVKKIGHDDFGVSSYAAEIVLDALSQLSGHEA